MERPKPRCSSARSSWKMRLILRATPSLRWIFRLARGSARRSSSLQTTAVCQEIQCTSATNSAVLGQLRTLATIHEQRIIEPPLPSGTSSADRSSPASPVSQVTHVTHQLGRLTFASFSCIALFVGRYTPTAGMTECVACEPGRYGRSENQSACVDCPAGQVQSAVTGVCVCACGGGGSKSFDANEKWTMWPPQISDWKHALRSVRAGEIQEKCRREVLGVLARDVCEL